VSDRRPQGLGGLHVLADDDPRWPHDPCRQAEAACRGGAAVVQLRCKHATDRQALEWGETIRAITRETGTLFFVNDRYDLALALDADGVHLGQDDLPPDRLPPAARPRLRVGRSTHTLAQARAAGLEDVDYVALGPIFGTTSKASPWEAPGLEGLRLAAEAVAPLPLIAIGGIDAARATAVAAAGAAGAAVISAVAGASDPVAATRDLVTALERGGAA
jgi:thiamine-phosphate pyrophosphorylase